MTDTIQLRVPRAGYDLQAYITPPADPDAPWVVFGNSLVTDQSIWDAQIAALGGRYGALRYDQAGHGQSDVPPDAIDFTTFGADLCAVIGAANVPRATYVGLSMGVPTGLAAYAVAPDLFSGLVLSDGQAKTAPGGAAGWDQRIATAKRTGMAAFGIATADRWLTPQAEPATRDQLAQMIAATPLDGFVACATALKAYDYQDVLAQITCPTLLIAGAADGAIPETMANTLHPEIAGARMAVIPDAGHVPCFEQPAAFNAHLLDFLEAQA